MKGNWCWQVRTAGMKPKLITCVVFRVEQNLTPSFFGSFTENAKLIDVCLFLFDEFLLITKIKRSKKVCHSVVPFSHHSKYSLQLDLTLFKIWSVFLYRGPLVQTRVPWGYHRTWSWISCWRRDALSWFLTSLSLWTASSSRILIS